MSTVIKVNGLSRNFKEIKAVSDLSFTVAAGQVYGFLGQNGAGKSTTIRMLLTLIQPTTGSIEIFGMDLYKHRKEILRKVGAIIEKPDLYKYLTAIENLRIFSAMSGVRRSRKELMDDLSMVGLQERAESKVKTYSQGMRQRLGIAAALVHDPELIILDEPMNGLDPQGIADMRNLILQLAHERGKTIFISSHLLNEMELIADSMLIIDNGSKVIEGTKDELLNPARTQVELITDDDARTLEIIGQTSWSGYVLYHRNGAILLEMERKWIPDFNRKLVEQGVNIISIRPKHSLEDYFLSLTSH